MIYHLALIVGAVLAAASVLLGKPELCVAGLTVQLLAMNAKIIHLHLTINQLRRDAEQIGGGADVTLFNVWIITEVAEIAPSGGRETLLSSYWHVVLKLPFAPFVGLKIILKPQDSSSEYDDWEIEISEVRWVAGSNEFLCTSVTERVEKYDQHEIDIVNRAFGAFSDADSMAHKSAAEFFAKRGEAAAS